MLAVKTKVSASSGSRWPFAGRACKKMGDVSVARKLTVFLHFTELTED
jgi:hypothetical protein